MRNRDLEEFRTLLETHLAALTASANDALRRVTQPPPNDAEPHDQADESARLTRVDDVLAKGTRESALARRIEGALARVDRGDYGVCADCGDEIDLARLRAVPWAERCADDEARREFEGRDISPGL